MRDRQKHQPEQPDPDQRPIERDKLDPRLWRRHEKHGRDGGEDETQRRQQQRRRFADADLDRDEGEAERERGNERRHGVARFQRSTPDDCVRGDQGLVSNRAPARRTLGRAGNLEKCLDLMV